MVNRNNSTYKMSAPLATYLDFGVTMGTRDHPICPSGTSTSVLSDYIIVYLIWIRLWLLGVFLWCVVSSACHVISGDQMVLQDRRHRGADPTWVLRVVGRRWSLLFLSPDGGNLGAALDYFVQVVSVVALVCPYICMRWVRYHSDNIYGTSE